MPSTGQPRRRKLRSAGETPAPHKLETIGLIVVAVLILALTVFRYWHNINWRGR